MTTTTPQPPHGALAPVTSCPGPECRAVGQDAVRAIYAKHRGSA